MIVVSFKMLFQFYIAQFVVTLVLCESLLYFTMILWYIFVSKVIVFFNEMFVLLSCNVSLSQCH